MNHIQQFEKFDFCKKQYWMVPTDERFEESAKKIGFDSQIFEFDNDGPTFREMIESYEYIFISFYKCLFEKKQWYWTTLQKVQELETDDYKFMGYINMTPDEIEEYELSIEVKKYNL